MQNFPKMTLRHFRSLQSILFFGFSLWSKKKTAYLTALKYIMWLLIDVISVAFMWFLALCRIKADFPIQCFTILPGRMYFLLTAPPQLLINLEKNSSFKSHKESVYVQFVECVTYIKAVTIQFKLSLVVESTLVVPLTTPCIYTLWNSLSYDIKFKLYWIYIPNILHYSDQ